MKKTRSVVLAAVPVALGAVAVACWAYTDEAWRELQASGGPAPGAPTLMPGSEGSPSPVSPGPSVEAGTLPCDVLEAASIPCVSAHSTVRVVVRGYDGSLYQVQTPNGMTLDVGTVDGYADAAAQDAFCAGGGCVSAGGGGGGAGGRGAPLMPQAPSSSPRPSRSTHPRGERFMRAP